MVSFSSIQLARLNFASLSPPANLRLVDAALQTDLDVIAISVTEYTS